MKLSLLFVTAALFTMNAPLHAESHGVAVVELFTSEGCSSCPSADTLLTRLHQAAQKDGSPTYTLAFHVDYWNNLGWTDRFSSPAWTQRQNDYAQRLHLDSLYTPQMIVGGHTEFVGSDSSTANRAIAAELKQPAAPVTVKATVTGKQCKIEFGCDDAADADLINVAIVEDGLSSDVKRGENSGRQLNHSSVVRWFTTRPSTQAHHDTVCVDLDAIDPRCATAIVYVQDGKTFRIRGAAEAALIGR